MDYDKIFFRVDFEKKQNYYVIACIFKAKATTTKSRNDDKLPCRNYALRHNALEYSLPFKFFHCTLWTPTLEILQLPCHMQAKNN